MHRPQKSWDHRANYEVEKVFRGTKDFDAEEFTLEKLCSLSWKTIFSLRE